MLTLVKTLMILRGVDQNYAQVIQGALIVLVVMIGGLAIRQKGKGAMSAAPADAHGAPSLRRLARRTARPSCSRSSSSAIFVGTDIVNRAQGGGAFLTLKQVSTTFLFAAVLGLIAAGQTLVMLTGGVDLSVATTATAGAFMVSRFGDARVAEGDRGRARGRARDRPRERDRRRALPRERADHDARHLDDHARRC